MTRMAGRTALILGPQDVEDLCIALAWEINCLETRGYGSGLTEREYAERLVRAYQLGRRLEAAASRIERGRNGRSEAAV